MFPNLFTAEAVIQMKGLGNIYEIVSCRGTNDLACITDSSLLEETKLTCESELVTSADGQSAY